MPCSCFGKKDKKGGIAGEEKYSVSREQEPVSPPTPTTAPTPVTAPDPVETPAPGTPPVTPTAGGDARLRPEDDPDKATRRRDVVASFYSDQCELIGFKATGSRPPSAVVGSEGPAATSSPVGSPPSGTRSSALSRADLVLKRREFFKDLAVNDLSSSRYGTSQPSWRMVDSGSLTTPRRSHQQDNHQHHTLPLHARAGGFVLRPVTTPPEGASGPAKSITNGDTEHSQEQRTGDATVPEKEPLLGSDHQEKPGAHSPEFGNKEPLLTNHQPEFDPLPTNTAPEAAEHTTAEKSASDLPGGHDSSKPDESSRVVESEYVATHSEDRVDCLPRGDGSHVEVNHNQYVQQVSVQSDDERLAEGSCILIKEAFPEEPQSGPETPPPNFSDIIDSPEYPAVVQDDLPSRPEEASREATQHSTEQLAGSPSTQNTDQRRPSFDKEEGIRHSNEKTVLETEESKELVSSAEPAALTLPSGPLQDNQQTPTSEPLLLEDADAKTSQATLSPAAPPEEHAASPQHLESTDHPGEERPSVAIVGCIPKATPTQEPDLHLSSPPETPPVTHQLPPSPPSSPTVVDEVPPPASPTPPYVNEPPPRAPQTPPTIEKSAPSLSEQHVTCGVDPSSSSPLEDDGLGSDIDDALGSLECLSEEELLSIMAGELAALVARLETAVERLEKAGVGELSGGGHGGPSPSVEEECTVPFVVAYDDLLSGSFKTFYDCSQKIGGDVATIAKLVQDCFINQRAFLVMASKSQRPLDTELPQVLEPTGKKIQEVIAFRESNRQSKFFNHLSAVSESISGLSWVAVAPAPSPYVKEMGDAAVFYSNRVLKDYREKDKIHVEWVQNWNNVFKELQEYVRKHHTTGLSWNTLGGNAMKNLKVAPPNCGVPPPPPAGIPPPPPMVKLEPKSGATTADDGRSALFASINKGTEITSGLKKVSDDMKTHKNPSLREGPKPFVKQSSPGVRSSPARDPMSGTSRIVLEGKKWFVEYQKDNPNVVISNAKMDQSVYIFRCQNTVVQVKGKVNSVTLDSCKKSSVVFDNLVSSAEVVNCQSCQVQVMGVMPTVSIEKTDGCQVYLSKESLGTEIVTAKSTEMNVMIPKPDGEFAELPIPEQFLTKVNGLSLTTTCTESC